MSKAKPTQDEKTYAPFVLIDARKTEWHDVRLSFSDWDWLHEKAGGDSVDGYYLNGYGVQGLVQAAMVAAGLDADQDGVHYDSEGDTCFIHFEDMKLAKRVAELAAAALKSRKTLERMVGLAREAGLED